MIQEKRNAKDLLKQNKINNRPIKLLFILIFFYEFILILILLALKFLTIFSKINIFKMISKDPILEVILY